MPTPTSKYAFALCQPGVERWLKAEVARVRPDLHSGFQRPGLVSFKAMNQEFRPDETVDAIFARTWGCAAGSEREVEGVLAVAARVGATHLWLGARDQGVPEEIPPARQAAADAHAAEVEQALRAGGAFSTEAPKAGAVILDVVTSPDEASFVGWHIHGPRRHQGPCGRWTYEAPALTPSRAWKKITEGLLWADVPLKRGQKVLELGASPGGATSVLVERGASVLAVDPNPLDEALVANPSVRFLRRTMGELRWEDLPPGGVHWIVADPNIPPAHAINGVARLLPPLKRGLRGLLLTLKLNDDEVVADLPAQLERLKALGAVEVRATQLPSNRGDIFVYAKMERKRR